MDNCTLTCEHCGTETVGKVSTALGYVGIVLAAGYCPVCGERVRKSYRESMVTMRRTIHDLRRS